MADWDLLTYAADHERALVTENVADFMPLAAQWTGADKAHAGLIFTNPRRFNRAILAYPGNVMVALPPADSVLVDAVAVVRGRVVGFPNVDRYTLDAELEVTEVLYQNTDGTSDVLTEGPLVVGAYDDSCGRRTGLRFTDNETSCS